MALDEKIRIGEKIQNSHSHCYLWISRTLRIGYIRGRGWRSRSRPLSRMLEGPTESKTRPERHVGRARRAWHHPNSHRAYFARNGIELSVPHHRPLPALTSLK